MNVKKVLYNGIIVLLAAAFLFSAYQLLRYFIDGRQQMERYNNLASMVEEVRLSITEVPVIEYAAPTEEAAIPEVTEAPILPEYQPIYDLNPDVVGWLKIEDTRINYPVMQTPDNPNYYLYRNFDKEYNVRGCLYAAELCDIYAPSDNITIHGHHMNDGSMLADLKKFQNKSFWESHPIVIFDTLTEHHTYQVFSVFKTSAAQNAGFAYHLFVDAENKEDFNNFIKTCKNLSFYDTGITPVYGDKIICLSTCEYTLENGRLVLAAVRVD